MPTIKEADYITVREAAKILNVTRARVYQLINQGRIKGAVVFWGKTVMPPESLNNILPGKHSYPISVGHKGQSHD